MGLNIPNVVISKPRRQRTGGLRGRSWLSRVRCPRRSSAAEVSRGSQCRTRLPRPQVTARPSSGLSHGVAGVPTRGCCGERGPDAAGPGAQRGALGCPPARPAAPLARDCSGLSAACASQASMAFTRKRQREQQLQLYSKERCAGWEAGPGGSQELSCRPRPTPGPQSRGWAGQARGTRDAKAGPSPRPPARRPAGPPSQPASPRRPSVPRSRPA